MDASWTKPTGILSVYLHQKLPSRKKNDGFVNSLVFHTDPRASMPTLALGRTVQWLVSTSISYIVKAFVISVPPLYSS